MSSTAHYETYRLTLPLRGWTPFTWDKSRSASVRWAIPITDWGIVAGKSDIRKINRHNLCQSFILFWFLRTLTTVTSLLVFILFLFSDTLQNFNCKHFWKRCQGSPGEDLPDGLFKHSLLIPPFWDLTSQPPTFIFSIKNGYGLCRSDRKLNSIQPNVGVKACIP